MYSLLLLLFLRVFDGWKTQAIRKQKSVTGLLNMLELAENKGTTLTGVPLPLQSLSGDSFFLSSWIKIWKKSKDFS